MHAGGYIRILDTLPLHQATESSYAQVKNKTDEQSTEGASREKIQHMNPFGQRRKAPEVSSLI